MTLAVVLAGVILRWWSLAGPSLWFDEGYTAWMVSHDWPTINRLVRADTSPPLYYYLLASWSQLFSDSEWGLRSMSAAAATGAMLIVWAIAGRIFRTGRARFAAVALFALSAAQIQFAQNARGYALLSLLSAATIYCLIRRAQGGPIGWLIATVIFAAALLYVHNIELFYLPAFALALLIWPRPRGPVAEAPQSKSAASLSPSPGTPGEGRGEGFPVGATNIAQLRDAAIFGIVAAILYLPWLPALRQQIAMVGSGFWVRPPNFQIALDMLAWLGGSRGAWQFTQHFNPYPVQKAMRWLGAICIVVLLTIPFWRALRTTRAAADQSPQIPGLDRRRRAIDDFRKSAALAVCALAPWFVAMAYSLVRTSIFMDKAFIGSTPPLALALAVALDWRRRDDRAGKSSSPPSPSDPFIAPDRSGDSTLNLIAGLSAIAMIVLCIPTIIGYFMSRQIEDWRSAARFVADLPPAARLIEFDAYDGQPPFDYYYRRMGSGFRAQAESGVPMPFYDGNPPRTMLRLGGPADLAPLKSLVNSGRFGELDLVASHLPWADPDNLVIDYLDAHARLIDRGDFDQVSVLRYALPRQAPVTRAAPR